MGWPKGKPRPDQSERMRKLHADPEFAAKSAERMRKLNAERTCVYCGAHWAPRRPLDRDGDDLWACRDERACERRIRGAA